MKKIIIAILIIVFMNNFDITALNLALPLLINEFHFTYNDIHIFSAIYFFSCGLFFIPSGYFGDRLGHYKVFFMGIFFFLSSSFIMAISHHAMVFLVGRSIQGMSIALTLANIMPIIYKSYKSSALKKITLVTFVIAISQAIGPILGALVIYNASWRYLFIINIPISIIAIVITYPTVTFKEHSLNVISFNILKGIFNLLNSVEYRLIVTIRGLFQFVYFGMLYILPAYFLVVLKNTIIHTSCYVLSITLGFSFVSICQVATKMVLHNKSYLWIGFLCQIFGCVIYCSFGYFKSHMLLLCAGFIFGCGAALILPISFSYALEFSKDIQRGMASGLMLCIAFVAGGLGTYLSSHISVSSASMDARSIDPFIHTCLLYLSILIISTILSLIICNKGNKNA